MLPVKCFQCLKAGEIGEVFSKLLVASVTGLSREKSGKKKYISMQHVTTLNQ